MSPTSGGARKQMDAQTEGRRPFRPIPSLGDIGHKKMAWKGKRNGIE